MQFELRGVAVGYEMPYVLSMLRDRAGAAYARWRTV